MSLTTPFSVQKLQTALHAKAKESPDFRFYALYDKVYRRDVLAYAYERCKAKGGAAGVDNQTFEDIELCGGERWLDELTQELKSQTYQPQPVRRVSIPKPAPTRQQMTRSSALLIGWANYFCLGSVSKAYRAVDIHARRRLRRWLCDKHNEPRPGYKRFPEASLHSVFGLVQLPHRTASLLWARA